MKQYYENLRRQAERLLEKRPPEEVGPSDPEIRKYLHELSVYQAELELQNEELRNAQVESAASQERYQSLYHDAPIGYITLTREGVVHDSNHAVQSMFFGLRTRPLGKRLADYVAMRDRPRFEQFLDRVCDGPGPASADFRVVRPDADGYAELRTHGACIRDHEDSVVEIRLALSDVTELKVMQRNLEEISSSLEQRVEMQVTDIRKQAAQLRALVAELNMAEQRERRRIAGELHDYLAQLLVASRLRTANIRMSLNQGEAVEGLRSVEELLRQGLTYTRSLIAELSPSVLFESGLPAALRHLGVSMLENKLKVDVAGVQDVQMSETAAVLLYQCIRELLFNCLKHAQTDVAYVSLSGLNEHVQAIVRDEGRGADAAELVRAEPLRDKFGLFGIRERVEAIKGTIFIETSPGHGMTCTLEIPAEIEVKQNDNPESDQARAPVAKNENAIRLLVVDDHTALRRGLIRYFNDLRDVDVAGEAGTGSDAIEKASDLEPDAVLMDINLPDMNGVEVTRRIKAESPGIAVVGLSMRDDAAIVAEMRDAGAASHLGKDTPIEQIVDQIRMACGRELSGAV